MPRTGDHQDLWRRSERVAQRAAQQGALQPIATRVQKHRDQDLGFCLHVIDRLKKKPAATAAATSSDPFLPHDPRLFVDDIGAHHRVLLNKYPVIPRHLLLVSRDFVPQTRALDEADFAAALALVRQAPGLLFYNAGKRAGASQRHRHLQLVDDRDPDSGERGWLGDRLLRLDARAPSLLPELPWAHAAMRCDGGRPDPRARDLHRSYERLLDACALSVDSEGETGPYNLLFVDRAMLLVPRRREHAAGLSINALGFAGQLLAGSDDEARTLLSLGLVAALREVAGPPLDLPAAGDAGDKGE